MIATRIEKYTEELEEFYDGGRALSSLSEKKQERIMRIELAHRLLMNHGVVSLCINKFLITFPNVSRSTMYQSFKDAETIYGEIIKPNKSYRKLFYAQKIIRQAEILERKHKNFSAAVAYEKAAKIEGVEKEDSYVPNPSSFQMPSMVFVPDTNLLDSPVSEEKERELRQKVLNRIGESLDKCSEDAESE